MDKQLIRLVICLCLAPLAWGNACTTTATGSNWSSASHWTSCGGTTPQPGDTVTIANATTVDVNATFGTSPASGGTAALVINAALTVAPGVTLVVRGPVTAGNAAVTFGAGSVFEFDSSQATDPTAQSYAWTSNAYVRGNRMITCNGTPGSPVTIRSNAGGGSGYFYATSAYSDSLWFNCSYAEFVRIGDAVNNAISFNPQADTTINTLKNVTFDAASGRVEFVNAVPAGGGFDFEDVRWLQTNSKPNAGVSNHKQPLVLKVANAASTATRKIYRNVFIVQPYLASPGVDLQDNYFHQGWDDNVGGWAYKWAGMSGSFLRLPYNSGQIHTGDVSTSFVLYDAGAAATSSGTVTAATTTTLSDSGKTWTVDAYKINGSAAAYLVEITGGTGVGQRRLIVSNTATQLTVAYRWNPTPDTSSTYAVVADIPNTHGLNASTAITSGTVTLDTVIWQSAGCDTQGDNWLHLKWAAAYVQQNNIVLPNAMGDSSGTLATNFGTEGGQQSFLHNTVFGGAQSCITVSEQGAGTAGSIAAYKSNICWRDGTRTYFQNGGNEGNSSNASYHASASSAGMAISSTTQDIVTAGGADYNAGFGLTTPGYTGNGYNYRASSTPGTHDVTGDPKFVDPTRSFWSWAVSRGSTAQTITGQVADGLSYLQADPTLTRTSLIPYIQAGFAPRNTAFKFTYPGDTNAVTNAGAVEGKWSGGVPAPVIWGLLRDWSGSGFLSANGTNVLFGREKTTDPLRWQASTDGKTVQRGAISE